MLFGTLGVRNPPAAVIPQECGISWCVGRDKATLLQRAAHNWNEAGVQTLLGLGADPDALDEHGRQRLH